MKFFLLLLVFLINSLVSISAPFPANLRDGFLIQDIGSGNIRVTQMDIVTGNIVKTDVLSVGGTGNNAYGYNPDDNYIYGIQIVQKSGNDDYNLVRIEPSGGGFSATVKPITGLVHNVNNGMFIGDFDRDGNMYVGGDSEDSTDGPIFKITINPNGSGTAQKLSADRGSPRFADWGYTDKIGGEERFYFVSDNGGLYYFKKSGNTLQKVGPISTSLGAGGTVIGTFIAGTDLFYYPSGSSALYKVDLLNPSQGSQPFSTVANPSSSGDAARNYKIIIPDLAIAKEVTNGPVFNQGEDIRYKITVKNTGDYPLGDPLFNSQYIVSDKIDPQKVDLQATSVTAILYPTLTGNAGTPVAGFPTTIDYTVSSPNIGLFKLTSDSGVLPLIPKGARLEIEYTLKSKIYFMTKDEDTIINLVTGEVPNKKVTSDAQVEVKTLPPELKMGKDVEPKKPLKKGESLQYTLKIKNTSTTKPSTSNVVKDILKADVNKAFETFSVYQSNGTTLLGEVIDTDGNSSNNLTNSFSNGETTITIETISTLAPGEEKIYIIKGLTKTSFNENILVNYGTVDSRELDLITSNEVESTFTGEEVYDYGDAPDRYKTITSNPPRHKQVQDTPYFGAGVDYETVWTQSLGTDADLDDRSQRDDEDGIVAVNGILSNSNLPITLIEGIENTITINVGKVTQGGAKIKIWLDGLNGNINETFDNNNNQVIYNGSVNSSGNIDVKFGLDVLGNRAGTQGRTYLRMRITSSKNDNQINSAGGVADDGEVEDHLVFISERKIDYGDLPDTYKTRLSSDGPRHLDVYLFGQASPVDQYMYLGENKNYENDAPSSLTGVEDMFDDGVKDLAGNVLSTLYVNEDNIMTIKASHAGYIGMWVDFNGDGTFDASESIIQQVVAGNNQLTIPASRFSNYPDTSLGSLKGVRVRYSKDIDGVNKPNGLALTGEVEDYYIPFIKKVIDVEIVKTPVTEKIAPNGVAKYKLVITNTGNQPLSGYTLKDTPDLSKVDIASLNVTSILVNGAAATGVKFEADASGVIKLIGAPTIEVGNKLEILYELTAKDFDILQDNKITNIASLVVKPGDPEQKSQADVLVAVATVTKTSPQAGKIVQPGDKVEYVITLTNSTNTEFKEFVLYDGLLADNSFLTLNDITKVPTIVGNSLFASGGVKVDVQANSTMEIKYELTIPSIPTNIALPVEITNVVLDQKVVVTV
ncbi:MAG: GEVED domain-containing protein, partial [Cetobacterium sp.]